MRLSRPRTTRLAVTGCVAAGLLAVPAVSEAAFDTNCSQPSRAVCATSDAGSADFKKDSDGNYTTLTRNEYAAAFWSVQNNTDQPQTVNATLVLDGPGTAQDRTLTMSWVLAPDELKQSFGSLFKAQPQNVPAGTYTWTVTATGAETVSASSTFTVSY